MTSFLSSFALRQLTVIILTLAFSVPARTFDPRTSSINWVRFDENGSKRLASASSAKRLRVMVDPGHGGKDLGAPGHHNVLEKIICLKIAQHVKRELERMRNVEDLPIEVMLTREDDSFVGLKDRVRAANDWEADLFVSIHANSSPLPKVRGFEIYFLSNEGSDEEARRLALVENGGKAALPKKASVMSILSDVQTNHHIEASSHFAETMFSSISRRALSRGRGLRQGPFTVLAGTSMPSVLVEVGYVTHSEEAGQLTKDSYLKRLASGISTGIVEFALKKKRVTS